MVVGGLSARVREGRRGSDEEADTRTYTWTHVPTQTQVMLLEEKDVELT